jgi:hypothetical protein
MVVAPVLLCSASDESLHLRQRRISSPVPTPTKVKQIMNEPVTTPDIHYTMPMNLSLPCWQLLINVWRVGSLPFEGGYPAVETCQRWDGVCRLACEPSNRTTGKFTHRHVYYRCKSPHCEALAWGRRSESPPPTYCNYEK